MRGGRGSFTFRPSPGGSTARRIVALASIDGVPIPEQTLARYTVPRIPKAGRPGRVSVTRAGTSLSVRWTSAAGATRYGILLKSGNAASRTVRVGASRRSVVLKNVPTTYGGSVAVSARGAAGDWGKPRTATFQRRTPALHGAADERPQREEAGAVATAGRLERRRASPRVPPMTPPNVLVILTDQLRYPPPYESDELAAWRRAFTPGQERLRENGVSFARHYAMSAACAPSRASLLTGHYPSLHGMTQTDGIAKSADGDEMTWLARRRRPDARRLVPRRRLPHVLQGQVARLARAPPRPRRRGVPADDHGDGTPIPDAIDALPRGRPAGRPGASRNGSGPSRTASARRTPGR